MNKGKKHSLRSRLGLPIAVTLVGLLGTFRQELVNRQCSLKSIVISGELKADGVFDNSLAVSVLGNPANGVVVIVGYFVKETNH